MFYELFKLIMAILAIINYMVAIFVVFFERKNPGVTWAWLMIITFIPCFGFLFYFLLGFEGRKLQTFQKKAIEDDKLIKPFIDKNMALYQQQLEIYYKDNILPLENTAYLNNIVKLNMLSGYSYYSTNNEISIYNIGSAKFKALIADIRGAKDFIHLEYYIIRDDRLGRIIIKELAKKARKGIEVKLLYDGTANIFNSRSLIKPLINAGGEVGEFYPPRWIRINYRNHRKLAVIDGRIGYVGGINIGEEYVGKKKLGFWRDTHLRVIGGAVAELELRFWADWNFVKGLCAPPDMKYFPEPKKFDGVPMQILSSGPDTKWDNIKLGYFKLITEADKNIFIATPYFVPDDSILVALKTAALSGVDVRIIIPSKPDHLFVFWASMSYLGELLEAGVKCYLYKKGFIHSKVIAMDSLISSVGTANFDVRSFKLNFEVNAFIYDKVTTTEIENQFYIDFEDCEEITLEAYNSRGKIFKIREAIGRLVSPLL